MQRQEHRNRDLILLLAITISIILWLVGILATFGPLTNVIDPLHAGDLNYFNLCLGVLSWLTLGFISTRGEQIYEIKHQDWKDPKQESNIPQEVVLRTPQSIPPVEYKPQARILIKPIVVLIISWLLGLLSLYTNFDSRCYMEPADCFPAQGVYCHLYCIHYFFPVFNSLLLGIAMIWINKKRFQFNKAQKHQLKEKSTDVEGHLTLQKGFLGETNPGGRTLTPIMIILVSCCVIGLIGTLRSLGMGVDGMSKVIFPLFFLVAILFTVDLFVEKRNQIKNQILEMKENRRLKKIRELGTLEILREKDRQLSAQIASSQAEMKQQQEKALEQQIHNLTPKIKSTVLELATLFSKFQVQEIAEKSGVPDEALIATILNQLITRKEIDAVYFKSTKSIAFQHPLIETSPLQDNVGERGQGLGVQRQYEYIGGKVRLKIRVANTSKVGLLRVTCILNIPNSFRLLRVEPADYSAEKSVVKLQDLLPGEEKAVAYVLEPMICGKEQITGIVSGVDATGTPFAMPIAPLEVEVRCPLFASPEEVNLPQLQQMMADLAVKSERVFFLPEMLSPLTAFDLAKAVISERDVRFVGTIAPGDQKEGDCFNQAAWFYGTTKVGKKRYVLTSTVSEKDRTIRLATACDDEAGCTGFLAEAGAAVRRELVRRGAFESEERVVELVCEKCGASLPSAPTLNHDVRCLECHWLWCTQDFFR